MQRNSPGGSTRRRASSVTILIITLIGEKKEQEGAAQLELDLESNSDCLPALVQQSQQRLDCFAVASAVSDDLNRHVSNSVHFAHKLIVFVLQRLHTYLQFVTGPHRNSSIGLWA